MFEYMVEQYMYDYGEGDHRILYCGDIRKAYKVFDKAELKGSAYRIDLVRYNLESNTDKVLATKDKDSSFYLTSSQN